MIKVQGVKKYYPLKHGVNQVLDSVSITINPGEHIGILGKNGSGKSTLLRILSQIEKPSSGECSFSMTTSWPLAFAGGFQGSLSGYDNLRFVCRIYGVQLEEKIEFVKDFSELGKFLDEPVKTYSSGMRARLAFAASLMIDFDCYLIDEVVAVGDYTFREKCERELFIKRRDKAIVIVSHDDAYIKAFCTKAYLLRHGGLQSFASVDDALAAYKA
jgi:capsular polysaccharide transport system ATP-binding protein